MSAHTSLIKSESLPFKHLLAKSSSTPDNPLYHERLHGHTAKVLEVAETLLDEIGVGLLRQLDLSVATWRQKFRRATLLGAYLHDLGKANSHFQSMLRRQRDIRNNPQSVRHEALTGVLCTHIDQLRSWLCPDVEAETQIVFQAAICAAVGHHLKTNKPTNSSRDFEITVHLNHADFNNLLRLGQSRLGLNEPPEFREPEVFSLDENSFGPNKNLPFLVHKLYVLEAPKWFRRTDAETQRWLAAVKALVIAADVAGSALPGSNRDIKDWVTEALRDVLSAAELEQLVNERLSTRSNPSRDEFQRKVEQSAHRVTLVRAGCGAGKTVAAYKWASHQAANLKLFFCYPTTGTTSQGFQDYVSKSRIEGKLIHSRASVDLENILSTPDDIVEIDKDGRAHEVPDTRLESLEAWSPPLVICTVDTILGLMQNNRRGLFSFPALARSAFVFDEVHSYDSKLFGALLRFIETFKCARILLMTASLPPRMLDALQKVCGPLESIRGPKTREYAPRYRLRFVKEENPDDEAWKVIKDELRNPKGGKVLWIANTVDRAVCLYRKALRDQLPVLLYHSRFRYFERVGRHDAVISAFDKENLNPVLAITTQVAEMSLDLSANLLVSDLAPPSALIQRLGRLNRNDDEPEDTALTIVLEVRDPKHAERIYAVPYVKPNREPLDEFMLAYEWVDALPRDPSPVSQAQLADALDEVLSKHKALLPVADSTWLDGEWHSQIDSLRAGDISVPIVLERDVMTIRDAGRGFAEHERRQKCRKEAIRRSLSIPASAKINEWKRLKEHGLYRIAKEEHVAYDEEQETGARWR